MYKRKKGIYSAKDIVMEDSMIKLSVYIITLNEEKRLEKTLQAVKQIADEIIIVDSGSTDNTKSIAEKQGAKFFYNKWESYADQKHYAQELCTNEWVLSIDADEVLSQELIKEIKIIKKAPQYDVYKIRIGEMFPGYSHPKKGTKKYNLARLYNRNHAEMPKKNFTKDRIKVNKTAKIGQLQGLIYHYSYLNLHHQIDKLNNFTDQVVETAISEHKRYGNLRLCTEFFRQFICYYIIKRNFLHGQWGFISSINHAYFRFLKIAKWREYQQLKEVNKLGTDTAIK